VQPRTGTLDTELLSMAERHRAGAGNLASASLVALARRGATVLSAALPPMPSPVALKLIVKAGGRRLGSCPARRGCFDRPRGACRAAPARRTG
jgi:hypothetical protein